MRHRDVRHQAVAEEGVGPVARAVVELVDHHHVARLVGLAHRAHRAHRDQVSDAELLEAEDVGAVVELGRQQAVLAAVPRQEHDRPPFELAEHVGVGGAAERRVDPPLLDALELVHGVEAGAADHAEQRIAGAHDPASAPAAAALAIASAVSSAARPARAVDVVDALAAAGGDERLELATQRLVARHRQIERDDAASLAGGVRARGCRRRLRGGSP